MPNRIHPSRREFLKVGASASLFPMIVPSSAFGANNRIVTGHIGVGGQGTSNLKAFLASSGASPAVVCDVDKKHLAAAAKLVEKCEAVADFRRVLDRKDIDAVVISTPDHWHALPTIEACRAGKDVYCEKPLSLTVAEGRAMVDAARKHSRIVQTGSQQRSAPEFRRACELVRSGKIGTIKTVLAGIADVNFAGPPVADSAAPPELDYNTWLGPAADRAYNAKHVHYNFRFFWDYSGGQMTNWGAHHIDIAQWGLGMDGTGPITSEATAAFHPEKWYEVTMSCRITHTYANGVTLVVGQGQNDIPMGTTFIGTGGTVHVNRGRLRTTPEALAKSKPSADEIHLAESNDHHANFLECVRSRDLPICDVEIGHRSATVCHLGNIAARLGRKIVWNPSMESIEGDAEAAAMLSRKYREPWSL